MAPLNYWITRNIAIQWCVIPALFQASAIQIIENVHVHATWTTAVAVKEESWLLLELVLAPR